jgi:hypothetical protein
MKLDHSESYLSRTVADLVEKRLVYRLNGASASGLPRGSSLQYIKLTHDFRELIQYPILF